MFFQLGDKVYSGLFAPTGMSYGGNDANYAQHALINGKPRLQLTGSTLEELTLQVKLRAEYCIPADEIAALDGWKSAGEILPLLMGTGEYKGDYVITTVAKEILQTLADSTIVEAELTITLLEHVAYNKAEQQAAADRKKASAVGDKKQVGRRTAQAKTSEAQAHAALMEAQLNSWKAAEDAQLALDTGDPETFADRVKKKIERAQEKMNKAKQKVSDVQQGVSSATAIISSVQQAVDKLEELKSVFAPPISLTSAQDGITNVQSATRLVGSSSMGFTTGVILRKY